VVNVAETAIVALLELRLALLTPWAATIVKRNPEKALINPGPKRLARSHEYSFRLRFQSQMVAAPLKAQQT